MILPPLVFPGLTLDVYDNHNQDCSTQSSYLGFNVYTCDVGPAISLSNAILIEDFLPPILAIASKKSLLFSRLCALGGVYMMTLWQLQELYALIQVLLKKNCKIWILEMLRFKLNSLV